jgi:hypothetical protein
VLPKILDNATTRSVASDESLHEATMKTFNVKLSDQEFNECKVDFSQNPANSGTSYVIGSYNWKVENDLQEGNTYDVVAVANDKSQDDVQTDEDIWKPYSNSNADKTFLMSYKGAYSVTKEPTQTIPVQLTRAAAKIQLTLHVNVPGYTIGTPSWKLQNYNTKTTVFGDNTAEEIKSSDEYVEMTTGSSSYVATTYSYAMSWTDAEKAPKLYVKIPLTKDGTTTENYYSIPVRDAKATASADMKLDRNTIYTIDATISNTGGSSEITYTTAGKVVYDFLPWSVAPETNVDADISYLMVTPKYLVMKNQSYDDNSITIKSSDPVTVTIKEVYYKDNTDTKITYTKDYTEYIGSTQFKPWPTEISLKKTSDADDNNGTLLINSPIPQNKFAKYIVVEVSNGTQTETVIIKQYPLVHTTSFNGWYSSRSTDGWVTKEEIGKSAGRGTLNGKFYYDNNGAYYAHYFKNGSVYKFGSNETTGHYNNHMYVIQVSSTQDSEYKIAHATTNDSGITSDHVVSPAFMIASQLGVVSRNVFNQSSALTHCQTYREVATNGTVFDGWRLPTEDEITFIVNFQKFSYGRGSNNNSYSPVEPVLKGSYYYTLNNTTKETGYNNSGIFVRCVRDLTPDEVKALQENWENE